MELVAVPAGPFFMGSDPTLDDQAKPDEQPSHSMNLAKFYIGKHEVTNIQYAAFLAATAHTPPPQWTNRLPKSEEGYPVVGITWYDAIAFVDWLSRTTHREFRLPTEAEWEKACRGTDGGIYPWGGTPPSAKMANFGGQFNRTTRPEPTLRLETALMALRIWQVMSGNTPQAFGANPRTSPLLHTPMCQAMAARRWMLLWGCFAYYGVGPTGTTTYAVRAESDTSLMAPAIKAPDLGW